MRSSRARGSIAVELVVAIPVFMVVLMGGLQIGRALLIRHNLESAVTHVVRSSAIANVRDQATIRNQIRVRMGNACKDVPTQVQIIPGPPGTPDALQVSSVCEIDPMFTEFLNFTIKRVTVVVAMPLS